MKEHLLSEPIEMSDAGGSRFRFLSRQNKTPENTETDTRGGGGSKLFLVLRLNVDV